MIISLRMMNNRIRFCLTAAATGILSASLSARSFTLFNNGETDYVIAADTLDGARTGYAARELQGYIKKISGADIPITGYNVRNRKYIRLCNGKDASDAEGSFRYESDSAGNITITGKGLNGLLYGVYSFLENELDCRWYTSDFEVVPRAARKDFDRLSRKETPGIDYRYVMYKDALDPKWCDRNRNNGTENYYGIHTFSILVPPAVHFNSHPEYFSMVGGKRTGDDSQLCLSNQEVVKVVVNSLLKTIKEHPGCKIYDVSQNDNLNYCRCPKCQELEKKYGGQSGAMLYFVNKVAREIRKYHPDKLIGTFAYKYTRKAPVGIVPEDNVVIRLCSIECCFSHSIDRCANNKAFVDDMKAWSKITDKLYIWDYVTNFSEYCIPNPNFAVLQSNVRLFRDNHAIGILEEGNYQCRGGEFSELRAYLLAKLLWNPDCDADGVVNDFMAGYYGRAGIYIRQYYDLLLSITREDTHLGINFNAENAIYDWLFILKAKRYLNSALKVADNEQIRNHVELAMMPVCYLECKRNPILAKRDGAFNLVRRVIERENIPFLYELYGNVPNSGDFIESMMKVL